MSNSDLFLCKSEEEERKLQISCLPHASPAANARAAAPGTTMARYPSFPGTCGAFRVTLGRHRGIARELLWLRAFSVEFACLTLIIR